MRKHALLALAALLCAPAVAAQETRTITFDEALRIALEQNGTLRLAENAAAMNSVAVREQQMQFLPDLRVGTQSSQRYGRYFNEGEGRISNETTHSLSAGVSSSVVLFDGLRNVASLRGAQLSRTAGLGELERTRQTVVFNVTSNYLSLIEQREMVRVRRENLASQEAQEAQIREYVDAGVRPISDLYQQQAGVANARLLLVEAERGRELAELSLVGVLQLDPFGSYDFQAPAMGEGSAAPTLGETGSLIQRALEQRVDLEAGEARLLAAEQGVRAAGASRWPTVSLSGGYNSGYNSSAQPGFMDQLNQRQGGSVGLSLSLPVFDRLSSRNATARAQVQRENARIQLENLRQEVALQVRRATLDYRSALAQLAAAEAQLEASRRALEAAQERYEVGAATLVEVTQARTSQVQAASDLVRARYGVLFQEKLMDYYLGRMDPVSLE